MARWHVAMAIGRSPALAHYYGYQWQPVGNLGMDLLVPPVAALIGIEPATKLAVMLIPVLTATGLVWTAREVHGRVPPTAFFALPLAYAWPFQFGFVNFELAQALAFNALALWLRLGRLGLLRRRALLFVPISALLWLAHAFGWGLFGLMAFGVEAARLRGEERRPLAAAGLAARRCLPLALPILFMLHPSTDAKGALASDWFNMAAKLWWVICILRDRWALLDTASLLPLFLLLYVGARDRRLGMEPVLALPGLLCLAAFLLLPRLLMGGAYVDMRIAPAALALGLIAIRPPPIDRERLAAALAIFGLLFFGLRIAASTASFAMRAGEQARELAALPFIPRGAPVLSLVDKPCPLAWSDPRRDHLPGMAVVRRDAFTNEQWALAGQQLLTVRYLQAAPYTADPSQTVYRPECEVEGTVFADAIAQFPRDAFDYVWTIGFPPAAVRARDLAVVWSDGRSTLYRVQRGRPHDPA